MYVLGLDVGTQGVRALIVDLQGKVRSEASEAFPPETILTEGGRFEQDPSLWRRMVFQVLAQAVGGLSEGGSAEQIVALSVTSTSGTLCLADEQGAPIGPAMMYSDARAAEVAAEVQEAGQAVAAKMGTRFSASWALCKLHWLQKHQPGRLAEARWWTSPTDLVIGWLSGEWGRMDWSNALKWGYDLLDLAWPAFISEKLGLPLERFPRVQAPGERVGRVLPAVAEATGLSPRTWVVAGATDGVASQLASGAASPGEWNSTLGTTLVLKGVSKGLLRDPLGRLYCHKHPDGDFWLPGGASNTGADCLTLRFDPQRFAELDALALKKSPTELIVYPLMRKGERFPFLSPEAEGFVEGQTDDEGALFAGYLEGLAYVERLAYQVVEELGGEVKGAIHVVGGTTQSEAGLQIRADVLGRPLLVPQVPVGAMGAAILAARGLAFPSVREAVSEMVHYVRTVEPRPGYHVLYQERYERFLALCQQKGYLS
ncbi:MAG: FGGY-family carbohydrate kinase [Anaerolineae bacterium]|nr:FGGY-family carbohydrate kinase [Anaerolineae bacterium]